MNQPPIQPVPAFPDVSGTKVIHLVKNAVIDVLKDYMYIAYGDVGNHESGIVTQVAVSEWVDIRNKLMNYGFCRDWSAFTFEHGVDLWRELNNNNDNKSFLELLFRMCSRFCVELTPYEFLSLSRIVSRAVSSYHSVDAVSSAGFVVDRQYINELSPEVLLDKMLGGNPWLIPLVVFSLFGGEIIRHVDEYVFAVSGHTGGIGANT